MTPIRILIVDDEPIARRGLRRHLGAFPDAQVIGACGDGQSAVRAIQQQKPDLVFLDIQMPELDGFGVVAAVGPAAMPTTIFVTAYDQYALQAFEAHALDYVLKPLDPARLRDAYQRATHHIRREQAADLHSRLADLLADTQRPAPPTRIVVKDGGRIHFVAPEEIRWVEAAGNYVKLYTRDATHLLRETMHGLLDRLPTPPFVRISRSLLVNLDVVRECRRRHKGSYRLLLDDGTALVSSRHYRAQLEGAFG